MTFWDTLQLKESLPGQDDAYSEDLLANERKLLGLNFEAFYFLERHTA